MISIKDLQVTYDSFELRDISINIEKNEFFVLMGPTGAGKTVLLESIAGLTSMRNGAIHLEGRDITALPPEKRGIGIVYQDYALFPHMTVRDNIIYGFRYHSKDNSLMESRFVKLTGELNISHLANRYPDTLSGGELQRTAIARAMMCEPAVLMLDEPLSALDPGFRREIQDLLKKLHQSTDITFLMVTHDFSEALSLADRAAVMNNGRIEQIGDVNRIFSNPATRFVADFVGMKNILRTDSMDLEIEVPQPVSSDNRYIAIRPEDIVLSLKPLESSMRNSFRGTVTAVIDRGLVFEVIVACGEIGFTSAVTKGSISGLGIEPGKDLYVSFKASAIHTF